MDLESECLTWFREAELVVFDTDRQFDPTHTNPRPLPHLLQRDCDACDLVLVRPALQAREDGEVDVLLQRVLHLLPRLLVDAAYALPVEDHPRPAKGVETKLWLE